MRNLSVAIVVRKGVRESANGLREKPARSWKVDKARAPSRRNDEAGLCLVEQGKSDLRGYCSQKEMGMEK